MMSQQDGEAARPDLVTGVTTLEKAAQGGRGFQTSSFDLGVLNRGNADEDLRRHGHSSATRVNGGSLAGTTTGGSSSTNSNSGSSSSRNSGSSSSGISGGSSSGSSSGNSGSSSSSYSNGGGGSSSSSNFETHSSGSRVGGSNSGTGSRQYTYSSSNQNGGSNSGNSYTDDDGDYEQYEDLPSDYEQNSQSNSQRSGGNGYQSSSANYVHSSRTGLNAGHESVNQKFMLYPTKRTTRDIKNDLGSDTLCKATKCVNVRCVVGPLDKNGGALIALRTRLVAHTLNKVSFTSQVL